MVSLIALESSRGVAASKRKADFSSLYFSSLADEISCEIQRRNQAGSSFTALQFIKFLNKDQ